MARFLCFVVVIDLLLACKALHAESRHEHLAWQDRDGIAHVIQEYEGQPVTILYPAREEPVMLHYINDWNDEEFSARTLKTLTGSKP